MSVNFVDKNSLENRLAKLLTEFARQKNNEDGYTMLFVSPDINIEVKLKKPLDPKLRGINIMDCILDEYYTDLEPMEQIDRLIELQRIKQNDPKTN